MSNEVDNLTANLTLEAGSFFVTVQKAGQSIRQLAGDFDKTAAGAVRVDTAMNKASTGFQHTIIILGALRFALMDLDSIFLALPKSVAKVSGEFQVMQKQLEGLSKGSTDLEKTNDAMRDMSALINQSKNSPFTIDSLTHAFTRLKSAGIDPLGGTMEAMANSVAKFGGNSEVLGRVSLAMQQMVGKGVVSMEELRRQLGEALPNAMKLMADGLGISIAQLTKDVSTGSVRASTAVARMAAQMELDAHGAAKRMMETFPGALARIETDFKQFQRTIGDQGYMNALALGLKEITAYLESPAGTAFAKDIGNTFRDAAESAILLAHWVAENIGLLKGLGIAAISAFGGSRVLGMITDFRNGLKEAAEERAKLAAANAKVFQDEASALQNANTLRTQAVAANLASIEREKAARQEAKDAAISATQKEIAALRDQIALENAHVEMQLVNLQRLQSQRAVTNAAERSSAGLFTPNASRVVDPAAAAAIRAETVAIDGEIAAAGMLIEKNVKHTAVLTEKVAALQRSTIALSTESEAMLANNAALIKEVETNKALVVEKTALAAAAGRAGSAIGAFAVSLGTSMLAAGAFYVAIEALVFIYEKLTQSARDAEAAQVRALAVKNGSYNSDNLKKDGEERDAKAKELAGLNNDITKLQRDIDSRGVSAAGKDPIRDGMMSEMKRLKKDAMDATKALEDVQARMNDGRGFAARSDAQQQSSAFLQKNTAEFEKAMDQNAIFAEYKAKQDEETAAKMSGADAKQLDAISKGKAALGQKLRVEELKIWQSVTQASVGGIKDYNEETQRMILKGQRDKELSIANEVGKVYDPDVSAKTKHPKSAFASFMEQQALQLEAANERIREATADSITVGMIQATAQRRLAAEIKGGKFNDKDGKLVGDYNGAAALKAMTETLTAEAVSGPIVALKGLETGIRARLDGINEAFNSDTLGKPSAAMAALNKNLERLKPTAELTEIVMKKLGITWDEFVGKIKNQTAEADMKQGFITARDAVKKLKEELAGLTGNKRAQIAMVDDDAIAKIQEKLAAEDRAFGLESMMSGEQVRLLQETRAKYAEWISDIRDVAAFKTASPITQLAEQWAHAFTSLEQVSTGWANNFVDQLVSGKFKFAEFTQSILADIAKIKLKQILSESLFSGGNGVLGSIAATIGISDKSLIGGGAKGQSPTDPLYVWNVLNDKTSVAPQLEAAKSMFDGLGDKISTMFDKVATGFGEVFSSIGSSMGSSGSSMAGWGAVLGSVFGFANGGIMSSAGSMNLHAYANGGVATSPQLAVFGEGSKPEAFVPLPDGRRIPVNLQGGGGAAAAAPQVTVNVINQSGNAVNATQGGQRFDGRQMVLDIVLDGMANAGGFRDNMRGAMGK